MYNPTTIKLIMMTNLDRLKYIMMQVCKVKLCEAEYRGRIKVCIVLECCKAKQCEVGMYRIVI
jgi:hypothetical protein